MTIRKVKDATKKVFIFYGEDENVEKIFIEFIEAEEEVETYRIFAANKVVVEKRNSIELHENAFVLIISKNDQVVIPDQYEKYGAYYGKTLYIFKEQPTTVVVGRTDSTPVRIINVDQNEIKSIPVSLRELDVLERFFGLDATGIEITYEEI